MQARLDKLRLNLARLRTARFTRVEPGHDRGFTLIELLVVIIIIGILAAIAIPVFLNQRQKGYDAGIKADLRNAATAEETYLTDFGVYTKVVGTSSTGLSSEGFKASNSSDYSSGGSLSVLLDGGSGSKGYCMTATSASGKVWSYNSEAGGLQTAGYTCPSATFS